jgi:hypothetical protein
VEPPGVLLPPAGPLPVLPPPAGPVLRRSGRLLLLEGHQSALLPTGTVSFLGLKDPDPLVRGTDPDPTSDPDPYIIMQKY